MTRLASVVILVVATIQAGSVLAQSPQSADLCAGLKQIAAEAPTQFKKFDAGEVRLGGGTVVLPNARRSSMKLPGVTACRILTGTLPPAHVCYFPAVSAAGVLAQAHGVAKSVGQCLGTTAPPRESKDGNDVVLTFVSGGLDYFIRVTPNSTGAVQLNMRLSAPSKAD